MNQDELQGSAGHGIPLNRRLSWEDLRFLSHELEAISRGGFPMLPALASLSRDMKSSRLKAVLESIQAELEGGRSLEEALQRQEGRFPTLMLALVRAGEISGDLTGVLALMSTHARNMQRVMQAVRSAMIYPTVLVTVSTVIFGFLLLWVVPSFQTTFSTLGVEAPGITRTFFALSTFLNAHGLVLLTGIAMAALGATILIRVKTQSATRRYWTGLLILTLPWYGRMYHDILQTRFARTLRLLLSSRVPVVDAILLSGAATGSTVAERAAQKAAERVAEGERLADALRETGFFSHKFCWLLGAGEDRGGVEDALEHIAVNLEREVEAGEQVVGALVAPLITLFLSGMAGLFLIALYAPLYGIGKTLGLE